MAATPQPKRAMQPGKWVRSSAGMASASIGVIASLLSIIFLVWPSLKPDSGPTALAATLSNPSIEQNVVLHSVYERNQTTPATDLDDQDLQTPGLLTSYDVAIMGYEGEALSVRWSMLAADTMERVPEEWLVDQPGWPDLAFRPEADSDQASGKLWTSYPPEPGEYVVRIELISEDGVRLSSLDSPSFIVEGGDAADTEQSSSQPQSAPLNPTPPDQE